MYSWSINIGVKKLLCFFFKQHVHLQLTKGGR